ncbi:benzoate-CoA ligase family protein [Roseofilum sp. Belize BBD 4]|uniref:benzoate-CoA ligase family protein n=1 Tax=unclassified Roseofilum TaxID=2620099 RepID=UPI000E8FE834|nr:benzoate-CoA ligase family protein [Roseofilum sp. Belize Diploria]MBP0033535.1 benzoate-CoA ligase family protein [Roseofilum sp. Belize BBD 4]HBQ97676.1 benzoate-CoA ligase family protein [Cyanobacteria bacterium UBA11691]
MNDFLDPLPSNFNAAAYFLDRNLIREKGDNIAFYTKDGTYTYSQTRKRVQQAANLLAELGVERENRIAILLPNTPEFAFAFWGAIWLGAIPVPIVPSCSVEDVHYILHNSRAKILLSNREGFARIGPIDSPFLRHSLSIDSSTETDPPNSHSFLSLIEEQNNLPLPADTHGDEPAFWLYTSGSTGKPKGVIHRQQSMVICDRAYGQGILGLAETDITYSVAPLAFAYGLGNSLYMPMAVGAAAVLSAAGNAFDIIADIDRYQPTIFFGIPSIYANLLAVRELTPLNVSSLRLCVSAAEQLPPIVWQQWREVFGLEICEGIGTTEFLHIFLSNRPETCKPGTSGRPVPGYEVRVVDESGQPQPANTIGDLAVKGESLMLGYWNRLSETRAALYGDTMLTGDKYICDEEGYFKFMGRKGDLFKANGQWISPLEIEEVLLHHPDILEVAIVPESKSGEQLTRIVAYIGLKLERRASPALEKNIYQFTKQNLPHFKVPQSLCFVECLPRTSTGKIHRKSLQGMANSQILQS